MGYCLTFGVLSAICGYMLHIGFKLLGSVNANRMYPEDAARAYGGILLIALGAPWGGLSACGLLASLINLFA